MTNEKYGENAVNTYIEKLKSSTRFELNIIKTHSNEVTEAAAILKVIVHLNTELENDSYKGVPTILSNDIVLYDNENAFTEKVKSAISAEKERFQTIDEAQQHYSAQPIGSFRAKEVFRIHPNRLLHVVPCDSCKGDGELICGACNGNGQVPCASCDVKGESICRKCDGHGVVKNKPMGSIEPSAAFLECDSCYGTGKNRCSKCNGTRKIECSTCHGSGKAKCSTCNETGKLTTAVQIKTYAEPYYDSAYPDDTPPILKEIIEDKIGIANFLTYGDAILIDGVPDYETQSSTLRYAAILIISEIDIQIDDIRRKIIIFGRDYTVFDSGGIAGELLKEDLDALANASDDKSFFSLHRMKNLKKSLSNFMKSEIHQEMLDEHNKGSLSDQIYEKIGRTLKKEYIDYVIRTLKHLMNGIVARMGVESATISLFATAISVYLVYLFYYSPVYWEPIKITGFSLLQTDITMLLFIPFALPYVLYMAIFYGWATRAGNARLFQYAKSALVKTMAISASVAFIFSIAINIFTYDMVSEAVIKRSGQIQTVTETIAPEQGTTSESSATSEETPDQSDTNAYTEAENTQKHKEYTAGNYSAESYVQLKRDSIISFEKCIKGDEQSCKLNQEIDTFQQQLFMNSSKSSLIHPTDSDAEEERTMYADECSSNNSSACYKLAVWYRYGGKDKGKAVKLFQKSCDLGYSHGCRDLKAI